MSVYIKIIEAGHAGISASYHNPETGDDESVYIANDGKRHLVPEAVVRLTNFQRWLTNNVVEMSTDSAGNNIITEVPSSQVSSSAPSAADYTITKSGSTYTATPRGALTPYSGTNFTTVMQNAVNALTPAGAQGSGGGKIHITKGTYTFGNEVVITGWEGITGTSGIPQSSLAISTEGLATKFIQNTSGQNAFVVKNCANVSFLDMYASMGANAKSFIFGDKTGVQSEMSFWGGTIRVNVFSASTTAAPIYIKNFFDLDVPKLWAYSSAYHAIILENDSSSVHYGNSHFGFVRAVGSASTPYSGLVLRSTNTTQTIGFLTFGNYECVTGYYGIYAKGSQWVHFGKVDLEANAICCNLDSGNISSERTRYFTIASGYMFPLASGTAISSAVNTGGHTIKVEVDTTNGSVTPLTDVATIMPSNAYTLQVLLDTDLTSVAAGVTAPHRQRVYAESSQSNSVWKSAGYLHLLTAKTTPADADEFEIGDNTNWSAKRMSWGNLKTAYASATLTETNKRITPRVVTVTQSATPAINTDTTDIASITGLAQAITSMSSGLTGTPSAGDQLVVEITDNGTGRAIVWGAKFEGDLPVLTANGVKLTVVFRWNAVTSAWRVIAVSGGSLYASTYVRVTMSGSPAQTTAVTTWEKLQFATESSDLGGNFNNTSGGTNPWGYTTPAAGVYLATISARLTDSSALDTGMGLDISAGSVTGDVWSPVKTSANGTRFSMNATRMFRVTGAGTAIYGCVFGDTALSVKDAEMTVVKVA